MDLILSMSRRTMVILLLGITIGWLGLAACNQAGNADRSILIGFTPQAFKQLVSPKQPDPLATGIATIDALNLKWHVEQMIPLFPNVSPDDEAAVRNRLAGIYKLVVTSGTDLEAMIRDYEADSNIAYAERNQTIEIK